MENGKSSAKPREIPLLAFHLHVSASHGHYRWKFNGSYTDWRFAWTARINILDARLPDNPLVYRVHRISTLSIDPSFRGNYEHPTTPPISDFPRR